MTFRDLAYRCWITLMEPPDPWHRHELDVQRPAVKRMIARARLDRRREAGAGVVPKYSRDTIIERRERKAERIEKPSNLFLAWTRAR